MESGEDENESKGFKTRIEEDDTGAEKREKASTANDAFRSSTSTWFLVSPFFEKKNNIVPAKTQLPGDAKLSYFDAENTMQEISVDELTKGKRVGASCFLLFVSPVPVADKMKANKLTSSLPFSFKKTKTLLQSSSPCPVSLFFL